MKQVSWFLFVCFTFFFSATFIFSNDGSYTKIEGSRTGAAMPINNDAITMLGEDIGITIDRLDYIYNWLGEGLYGPAIRNARVLTSCVFRFKNESHLRQEVLMGYPVTLPVHIVDHGNRNYQQRNYIKSPDTYFFEVRARNEVVPFEFGAHESNPALPDVGPYQGVYLFKVFFEPNEEVTVTNTVIQQLEWVNRETPRYTYILTTGGTWKKPIGRSHLTVNFPGVIPEILDLRLPNYQPTSVSGTIYNFEFTNFSPQKDLDINFNLKINRFEDLGNALKRCYSQKDFEAIRLAHSVMSSGVDFRLDKANLDVDFLRQMYFSAGNYFHSQNRFSEAAEMFKMSLSWSAPIISWVKRSKGIAPDNYSKYLSVASEYQLKKDIISSNGKNIEIDAARKAPAYYCAYNYACASARLGDYVTEDLELALILGYPRQEFDWIRKDPDLEAVRKFNQQDLDALLKKYSVKK